MARTGNSLLSLGLTAAGVIGANLFVGFDDLVASVQGQKVKGVSEYPATAIGQVIAVTTRGTAWVTSGGAVAVGDDLITDNQGRAITASALAIAAGATAVTSAAANGAAALTGAIPPSRLVGQALMAATAAGQLIEILLP